MQIIDHCHVITDKNQKQLFSYIDALFPCTIYNTDFAKYTPPEFIWHWHKDIELVLVTEGSLFVDLGDNTFTVHKGQCLFINTNVLHFMKKSSQKNCSLLTIVFDPDLISGHTESIYAKRYILPLLNCQNLNYIIFSPEIDWQKICIDCFQKAYTIFTQEPPAFLFTIREQLSYICYYITENCQSEINAPNSYNSIEYQRTKQLLEYIHTQYNQPISLKSLALFANISERECFRCFQQILHTTPMTYITKYRISTALSLLQNTTLSITEIALSVGFNSSSYFSKIFREYMGSTPLHYRKNLSSRI